MAMGLHVTVYSRRIKIMIFWIVCLFLFFFSLILGAFSSSESMSLNDMILVDNELEGIWKEAIVAYFNAKSRKLPEATKKTEGNLSRNTRYASRDTNRISLKQLVTNISEVHSDTVFRVEIEGKFLLLACSVIDVANSNFNGNCAVERFSFEFRWSAFKSRSRDR
jgi:hypothetical protein